MRKINWEKAKIEYITTEISQRDIAEKYQISYNQLGKRAREEKWYLERKKHQADIVRKGVQKVAIEQATLFAKELRLADGIVNVLDKALDDVEQFNRFIAPQQLYDDDGKFVGVGEGETVYEKFDLKALKDAAQTLEIVERMKRSMNNILSLQQQEQLAIARERLDLDKKRASMGDFDETETGVVILAPVKLDDGGGEND